MVNHQKFIKKKSLRQNDHNQWEIYTQIKRFHYNCQLQVYMYVFIYVNPEKIPDDNLFPSTRSFVKNLEVFNSWTSAKTLDWV